MHQRLSAIFHLRHAVQTGLDFRKRPPEASTGHLILTLDTVIAGLQRFKARSPGRNCCTSLQKSHLNVWPSLATENDCNDVWRVRIKLPFSFIEERHFCSWCIHHPHTRYASLLLRLHLMISLRISTLGGWLLSSVQCHKFGCGTAGIR